VSPGAYSSDGRYQNAGTDDRRADIVGKRLHLVRRLLSVPSRADFADPGVAEQSKHPCQQEHRRDGDDLLAGGHDLVPQR
jgi:hypothetical protein